MEMRCEARPENVEQKSLSFQTSWNIVKLSNSGHLRNEYLFKTQVLTNILSLLWFPLALQQLQIKSLKSPNHRAATLAKLSFEMRAKEMVTKRTESAICNDINQIS